MGQLDPLNKSQLHRAILIDALEDFWLHVLDSPLDVWHLSDGSRHDKQELLGAIETLIASVTRQRRLRGNTRSCTRKKQHPATRRKP